MVDNLGARLEANWGDIALDVENLLLEFQQHLETGNEE